MSGREREREVYASTKRETEREKPGEKRLGRKAGRGFLRVGGGDDGVGDVCFCCFPWNV